MINGVKYIDDAGLIFKYIKKHYCPVCGERLQLDYMSKIVNSKSPEARYYDFSSLDTYMTGNVEFMISVLYCPKCNHNYRFKEIKTHEKTHKKTN